MNNTSQICQNESVFFKIINTEDKKSQKLNKDRYNCE